MPTPNDPSHLPYRTIEVRNERGHVPCKKCGSSMMSKRWIFFGKRPGCENPECFNYGGKREPWTPPPPYVLPSAAELWIDNGRQFATPEQLNRMQVEELYKIRKLLEQINERGKPSPNMGPR